MWPAFSVMVLVLWELPGGEQYDVETKDDEVCFYFIYIELRLHHGRPIVAGLRFFFSLSWSRSY